jgi:hypothetical protein
MVGRFVGLRPGQAVYELGDLAAAGGWLAPAGFMEGR